VRKRARGHSRTEERRGRDESEHKEKVSVRGGTHFLKSAEGRTSQDAEASTLTIWMAKRQGQVRTRKESERVRGTHILRDVKSGHGKKVSE
jgi:hypothetical protein